MYELSPEQVKFITQAINRHNITFSHLREDMIDHVCCIIEEKMGDGKSFPDTFSQVIDNIGTHGFTKVQEQTILDINQTYQNMKKLMKISGIISTILVTFAALFKIQHWPFASILLSLGYLILLTLFLPSLMYVLYSENKAGKNRYVYISGFIGFFVLFLSFLFKIQHWPGANILMAIGVVLICLLFLPGLLNKFIHEAEDRVYIPIIYLGIGCLFIYFMAFLFKMQHWPGASILTVLSLGSIALVLLPWYAIIKMKRTELFEGSFIFITIALCWFVLSGALINLNVSIDIRPQYSKTSYAYSEINKYLKVKVENNYNEIVRTTLLNDKDQLSKLEKMHNEASILIANLVQQENEVISDFCANNEILKSSTDENAKLKFVNDNGLQSVRNLPVSSTIPAFDSITQHQFERYFEIASALFPGNNMEMDNLKTVLAPGFKINRENEKSNVYFTENSSIVQTVNSIVYLQNAVYNAEDLALTWLQNNMNRKESEIISTKK